MSLRRDRWLIVSLVFGIAFWVLGPWVPPGPLHMTLKGLGVGTLAIYALERSTSVNRPIAMVMMLGAMGDVLIEIDLSYGALAFLAGHCYACWFYIINRRTVQRVDAAVALLALVAIPGLTALVWPEETGVLGYSIALGAMVGSAWCSRYARERVALGALMFAVSDLLLFAKLGIAPTNPVPPLLVWPLYYFGQVLITLGVVYRTQLMITSFAPSRARA
jgi:uncharacterized membrane protein YhhN